MKKVIACVFLLISGSVFALNQNDELTGSWFVNMCKLGEEVGLEKNCEMLITLTIRGFQTGFAHGFKQGVSGSIALMTKDVNTTQELTLQLTSNETFVKNLVYPCIEGKSGKEVASVVLNYLDNHPEKLHEPFASLIANALAQTFPSPCAILG